jgi:hypothetical protein
MPPFTVRMHVLSIGVALVGWHPDGSGYPFALAQ